MSLQFLANFKSFKAGDIVTGMDGSPQAEWLISRHYAIIVPDKVVISENPAVAEPVVKPLQDEPAVKPLTMRGRRKQS